VLIRDYLRNWNHSTLETVDRAHEAVSKALATDRSIALTHVANGYVRQVKGDHLGALDAFEQAIALNPNNALAWAQKAHQLIFLGRAKEASAPINKAITISPRDPDLGIFYFIMGQGYFALADYDNSIKWLQKSVEAQPRLWFSRVHLISAYALSGQLERPEAQAALSEFHDKFKNWTLPAIQDWYAKRFLHHSTALEAILQELFKGLRLANL
jgi:tetratricopeptide (TPR) repeat protein